jgi:hypothetical protein
VLYSSRQSATKDLSLEKRVELLDGEELVAESRAVGLDPGVLPRTTRFDVARSCAREAAPVPDGVRGEFWTVVTADEVRKAAGSGDLVQGGHGGIGADGVGDEIAEGLSGELVGDMEELQDATRRGDVELVVEGPDVIRMSGKEPVRWRRRDPEAGSLVAPWRDPKTLFTPQTLDFLLVEQVALSAQHRMGPAIAPAGMVGGKVAQSRPEVLVGIGVLRPVTLGGAMLADDLTRPPLREAQAPLEHVGSTASLRRAHHFPVMNSRAVIAGVV